MTPNWMKFFIEEFEHEYIEVDLDNNIKISGGTLDVDSPELGMWMNNVFVDISSTGIVTAFELPVIEGNEIVGLWQHDYNTSIELIGGNEQSVYLIDAKNSYIYTINTFGKEIKKIPLLWPGKNVEITNNNFIVQSRNKLYVLPN